MTDRSIILDLLWDKAKTVLFISRESFLEQLEGWDLKGHEIDGSLAWITLSKGPEFHFQSVGPTRHMPLSMIKTFLQGLIDQNGYCLTRTPLEDTRQQRFNRRFGFYEVCRDIYDIHFRLDKI